MMGDFDHLNNTISTSIISYNLIPLLEGDANLVVHVRQGQNIPDEM